MNISKKKFKSNWFSLILILIPSPITESVYEKPQNFWKNSSNVFNEYVVYDENQVAVRYVLKLTSSNQDKNDLVDQNSEQDNNSVNDEVSEEDTDEESDLSSTDTQLKELIEDEKNLGFHFKKLAKRKRPRVFKSKW